MEQYATHPAPSSYSKKHHYPLKNVLHAITDFSLFSSFSELFSPKFIRRTGKKPSCIYIFILKTFHIKINTYNFFNILLNFFKWFYGSSIVVQRLASMAFPCGYLQFTHGLRLIRMSPFASQLPFPTISISVCQAQLTTNHNMSILCFLHLFNYPVSHFANVLFNEFLNILFWYTQTLLAFG